MLPRLAAMMSAAGNPTAQQLLRPEWRQLREALVVVRWDRFGAKAGSAISSARPAWCALMPKILWTAFVGSLVASIIAAPIFVGLLLSNPSTGPLGFRPVPLGLFVLVAGTGAGTIVAACCLSLVVSLVRHEDLSRVPDPITIAVGVACAAALVWLSSGLLAAEWEDFGMAAIGGV